VLWVRSILRLGCSAADGSLFRDLVRCHGVLLVYNPVSATSFQYITAFHEQIIRSKWRSVPVVLFSNTPPHHGIKEVHALCEFRPTHAIPFIEASSSRPFSTPFLTLLNLARQHCETSASISFGEGIIDFVTVAAAKVIHATRVQPRDLSASFPASRYVGFLLSAWDFLSFRRFRPALKFRR
jgi:hypothetical protein